MLHRISMNLVGLALVAATAIGCGGGSDGILPPQQDSPVLTSLAINPSSATLFTVAPGNSVSLTVTPRDQRSQTMSGLGTPSFSTSNAAAATVSGAGLVTAVGAGSAQITASLTSAGTTRTAVAVVTVQEAPGAVTVTAPAITFNPTPAHIAAGGIVTWTFETVPHNVVFSDVGAPADIPVISNASASRTFPVNGTFAYQCTVHAGMTGTVIVH